MEKYNYKVTSFSLAIVIHSAANLDNVVSKYAQIGAKTLLNKIGDMKM